MAEKSKFDGALGRLSKRPPVMVEGSPSAAPSTPPATGKGRPPGKRSDPEFSPTTFFVRKGTKRKAARLLEDQDAGKDLSDLVEQLLAQWISKNSHA
jgi:hypothetical protein